MDDKHRFVKFISRHVLLDSTRYLLEDFKECLRTLGVLEKIQEFQFQFFQCFSHVDKPLTVEIVNATFRARLCERGSNHYAAQQRAVVYWRDFLQDCEGECFLYECGSIPLSRVNIESVQMLLNWSIFKFASKLNPIVTCALSSDWLCCLHPL